MTTMHERVSGLFADILARLDADLATLPERTQGDPDVKTERAFFLAQRRAYVRALAAHEAGSVPEWTAAGWLVRSATRPGKVHRVSRIGLVLSCDCEAGAHGRLCHHKLLVEVHEQVAEQVDAHDDGLDSVALCDGTLPPAPLPFAAVPRDDADDAGYAEMLASLPLAFLPMAA
jgi:hypothetical protein